MCGIHLIIDKQFSLDSNPIRRMQAALHHRGPDAHAFADIQTKHQQVYIALNRLRITDLHTHADHIFHSPDGRYALTYNGAIYNYQALRKTLEKKYHFRTANDTELLLYLIMEEGEAGLSKVNGMFAFAFYDRQEEKLLMGRDRFGMKPLYYFEDDNYLIASSEIRGILASGLVEKKFNDTQVAHYFRFKFTRRPYTFYQDIYECFPGRIYHVSPGQKLGKSSFIHTAVLTQTDSLSLTRVEETLVAAVNRHISSEVPVGLFLSGGVDSTLLLAIASELGYKGMPVFSICNIPEEATYGTEDYYFARMAARQFGAELHEVTISSNLLAGFDEFISKLDQPIGDGASWLTFLLAQRAKPYAKVILSGAGADELFGGYNRHWAYYQYLRYYPQLIKVLPIAKKLANLLPVNSAFPFLKKARLFHKLATQIDYDPVQTFINFTAHLPLGEGDELTNPYESKATNKGSLLRQALHYDQENFLSADVLALTDRMTMQAGLEARLPYLDFELASLTNSCEATFLLKNGRKWLLKQMLEKRGGQAYTSRTKEGFGMPFGRWLLTSNGKELIDLLMNSKSVIYDTISYYEVKHLLQAHLSRKRDYSSELWTLILLTGWVKKEFGN